MFTKIYPICPRHTLNPPTKFNPDPSTTLWDILQTASQPDNQTNKQTDRQTDNQTNKQTDRGENITPFTFGGEANKDKEATGAVEYKPIHNWCEMEGNDLQDRSNGINHDVCMLI